MRVTRVCKRGSWEGVQVVMMFLVEDVGEEKSLSPNQFRVFAQSPRKGKKAT